MQDQRRHGHAAEQRPHVVLAELGHALARRAGRDAGPLETYEPRADARVAGRRVGEQLGVHPLAPVLDDPPDPLRTVLVGVGPPHVVRARRAREARVEDERARAFGPRGREPDRRDRAGRGAVDRRTLGADGVEDRLDARDALLGRRGAVEAIRHVHAAPVHDDEPGELADALEVVCEPWVLPQRLDVRQRAGHQHEVDRAIPGDGVGDVRVARAGVPGLRRHGRASGCARSPR